MCSVSSVKLGPPHISETIRARKLKFYTHVKSSALFRYEIFLVGGVRLVHPSVNLGPSHILETIRARKLKFYTHLDTVKYTFGYGNFFARGISGAAPPNVNVGDLIIFYLKHCYS